MQKIPTLFVRDPDDMRHLLREVHPDCGWVLRGEGVATRKYDGTCCMFDGSDWWARREVKPGKSEPDGWVFIGEDEATGKRMGWEPIENTGWAKFHAEALTHSDPFAFDDPCADGTYELCGPKINGNPEGFDRHTLIRHADAERYPEGDFPLPSPWNRVDPVDMVRGMLMHDPRISKWEGIVWHHPDGRMCKLKRRDFD